MAIQLSFYGWLVSGILAVIGMLGLWSWAIRCISSLGSLVVSIYQLGVLIYLTVVRWDEYGKTCSNYSDEGTIVNDVSIFLQSMIIASWVL